MSKLVVERSRRLRKQVAKQVEKGYRLQKDSRRERVETLAAVRESERALERREEARTAFSIQLRCFEAELEPDLAKLRGEYPALANLFAQSYMTGLVVEYVLRCHGVDYAAALTECVDLTKATHVSQAAAGRQIAGRA